MSMLENDVSKESGHTLVISLRKQIRAPKTEMSTGTYISIERL